MKTRKRVRWTLLVLLWIWAGCMFTVLDLFLNVSEFDGIRPTARWYRATRFAAHQMVGEPYRELDAFGTQARAEALVPRAEPAVREPAPPARLRLVDGGAPDAGTAAIILERLRAFAQRAEGPSLRAAAKRAIARFERAAARFEREEG